MTAAECEPGEGACPITGQCRGNTNASTDVNCTVGYHYNQSVTHGTDAATCCALDSVAVGFRMEGEAVSRLV